MSGNGPASPPIGLERLEDVFGLEDEEVEGAGDEVDAACSGSGSMSRSMSSMSNTGAAVEDDDDGPRAPARDDSLLVDACAIGPLAEPEPEAVFRTAVDVDGEVGTEREDIG